MRKFWLYYTEEDFCKYNFTFPHVKANRLNRFQIKDKHVCLQIWKNSLFVNALLLK